MRDTASTGLWRAAAFLAAVLVLQGTASGFDGPGSGTAEDPYRIHTVQQLQEMQQSLDANYRLEGDVDAAGNDDRGREDGFTPIGDQARPFSGCFDGRGFTIRGLKIAKGGVCVALFGSTSKQTLIRDVTMEKASASGVDYVALLVGMNNGTVTDCAVSGQVHGGGSFGGLIGVNNTSGTITRCSAAVDVSGGNHLGGLVGNNGGRIVNCYATGAVQGCENPGGLVGVNNGGTILNCYASGKVVSSFGSPTLSYPRGAGGLVGEHQGGGKVRDCFATGQVSGPDGLYVGKILGSCLDKALLHNSYCLNQASEQDVGVGKTLADSGPVDWEAVNTIGASFFDANKGPLGCWDFTKTWTLDRDQPGTVYPRLQTSVARP